MHSKQIWANLSARNLEKTETFYTLLGFSASRAVSPAGELASVSFGEKAFVINFFQKETLEQNTESAIAETNSSNEVVFSLSAESPHEVDAWVEKVRKAGGKVCSLPYHIDKGYTMVFADPDGHKFNVLYWPGM